MPGRARTSPRTARSSAPPFATAIIVSSSTDARAQRAHTITLGEKSGATSDANEIGRLASSPGRDVRISIDIELQQEMIAEPPPARPVTADRR